MIDKPVVICEIGANHKGSFDIASKMIEIASTQCDVDVIKFQKRDLEEVFSKPANSLPHPNPINAYGETYAKHREALEFSIDEHRELKKICEKYNKIYSSSVWDIKSAKEIISLDPSLIKIPSAMNLNFPLLEYVCKHFNGEIHVSLGMTLENEIDEIYKFFEIKNKLQNLVLYYCKSTYPTQETDLNLYQIKKLIDLYGKKINCIGFSGHHVGISVDVAALTLGAKYFERHFTLDRTWKGTDHSASLEPDGLRRVVRNLREANLALSFWDGKLDEEEMEQRNKLKNIIKHG